MTPVRFFAAAAVGALVLSAAGVVVYGVMFPSFYSDFMAAGTATGVERQPMLFWALAVGMLAYGVLITGAIAGLHVRTVAAAAGVAGLVSFFLWLSADFLLFAVTNVGSLGGVLVDPVLKCVSGAVAGAVVGAMLKTRLAAPATVIP